MTNYIAEKNIHQIATVTLTGGLTKILPKCTTMDPLFYRSTIGSDGHSPDDMTYGW